MIFTSWIWVNTCLKDNFNRKHLNLRTRQRLPSLAWQNSICCGRLAGSPYTLLAPDFYLVNTRMRSKRNSKMGRLCTPGEGGGSPWNWRWGCDVPFFLNGDAISEENMHFTYVYMLSCTWLSWKSYSISDYNSQNHMGFLKKSVAFGVPPAYSWYKRLRPRGWNVLVWCKFPNCKGFEMSNTVITYSRYCF